MRIVAATNHNLWEQVNQGRFRADLFYRLNVVSIHIPPLRDRPEAIPVLIDHYLALFRERFKRPALGLSDEARTRLQNYEWPGNVRELRNCLERATALATNDLIEAEQVLPPTAGLPAILAERAPRADASPATLDEIERQHIALVMDHAGGNRERAAAILGISSRTLYRKLREYETKTASAQTAD